MRILLTVILLGSTALGSSVLLAQTPAGDAANGKKLFLRDGCYECHGYAGQGGAAGARIAAIGLSAPALIHYVRAPAGQMPAYTDKVISDKELTDIHAYLQTMPKAKPAKDIPILRELQR